MTDLRLVPEPAPDTQPIGWRCTWVRNPTFVVSDLEKSRPQQMDYNTREEAEAMKATLPREKYVATVTPRYPRGNVPKAAARASLDAAGWPLQHRPMR